MSDPVSIRRADAADRLELTAMVRTSGAYAGAYRRIVERVAITADQIATQDVFVAERQGKVIGFYAVRWRDEGPELDYLFVADDAQGTGVGRALVNHMRGMLALTGASHVEIVSHPPAEAFYLRMGAVRVGIKPAGGNATWDRPVLRLAIGEAGPVSQSRSAGRSPGAPA